MESLAPNQNTALPPYNIIKGLLLETETCTRNNDELLRYLIMLIFCG